MRERMCKHEWIETSDDYINNVLFFPVKKKKWYDGGMVTYRNIQYCKKCGILRINPEHIEE